MGIEPAIREQATKATCLLVDGQQANPWLVKIDFAAQSSMPQSIELRLGLPILIFELQQCEVAVQSDNIFAFVLDDMKEHKQEALEGYLTIVRAIINPRPIRKSHSWFARVFTSPPKWTPPPAYWKWTGVNEIRVTDENALVIKGECCSISASTQAIPCEL